MYFSEDVTKELIETLAPFIHCNHVEEARQTLFNVGRQQRHGWFTNWRLGAAPENAGSCQDQFHKCAPGIVYLMECGDLIKIGRTQQGLNDRASGVRSMVRGMKVKPTYAMKTVCYFGLEAFLHSLCAHKRIKGEFFRLDFDDIAKIKQMAYWNQVPIQHHDVINDKYSWPAPIWYAPPLLPRSIEGEREFAAILEARIQPILDAVRQLKAATSDAVYTANDGKGLSEWEAIFGVLFRPRQHGHDARL